MRDFGFFMFMAAMLIALNFQSEIRCMMGNERACASMRVTSPQAVP
jgi:hypothetical protein